MSTIVDIHPKQSLLDIAIQAHGSLLAVILIASNNNVSITDMLTPGEVLIIPDAPTELIDIVAFYKKNGLIPATSCADTINVELEGIGNMIIEDTFIVA